MRTILFSALLLAITSASHAQKAAFTVDEVVAHVRTNVTSYRAAIPNFSADESVESQRLDGPKVKDEMTIQSSFRMTHSDAQQQMGETRTINLVNGKPPKDQRVSPPYSFTGGFANSPAAIGDPCVEFRFPASGPFAPDGNIVLLGSSKPASNGPQKCSGQKLEIEAIIDPGSFQVLHLEEVFHDLHLKISLMAHLLFVTMPSDHNVMKTLITYSPVTLGDKTFWLPKTVENSIADTVKPISLRYQATYTNYHRYTATSTIEPTEPQSVPR